MPAVPEIFVKKIELQQVPVNARISWNVRQRTGNYLLIEPKSSRCSRCMCIRFMQCKSRYGLRTTDKCNKVESRASSSHFSFPLVTIFLLTYCFIRLISYFAIRRYLIVGYFRDVYVVTSYYIVYMSIRRFPRCFLSFASWSYFIKYHPQ